MSPSLLLIWPPHVPTYFNTGHRLILFQTAEYLQARRDVSVDILDAGALNVTWRDICGRLVDHNYDIVMVVNEFGTLDAVRWFVRYCREFSPRSRIVTAGRLGIQAPWLLCQLDLDAVVCDGDPEPAVLSYVDTVLGDGTPSGLLVRHGDDWQTTAAGRYLAPEQWALPDPAGIPYHHYDRMYADDAMKFCGIPQRRELVVPLARGCPVGCEFCDVPRREGKRERRRSVDDVVAYIRRCFRAHSFEYASMYAPTFTLNRRWVASFCREMRGLDTRIPWKCVSTVYHLDDDVLQRLAGAGCVRVSVGVETLDPGGRDRLPGVKQVSKDDLRSLAGRCHDLELELNCFVILGLPGQSVEGARHTIEVIRDVGARVRPTIYTPYHRLLRDTPAAEAVWFDRHFLLGEGFDADQKRALYRLAFATDDRLTEVQNRIERRR